MNLQIILSYEQHPSLFTNQPINHSEFYILFESFSFKVSVAYIW